MLTFCQRFGTTPERRAILRGLLDLRAALANAGFTESHQWLDGSFVEDVEQLRGRPPQDIDVVTFAALGDGPAQRAKLHSNPVLYDPRMCKARYRVDHYLLPADRPLDEAYARRIGYWYSMWSRQRETGRWKGFVSVPLVSTDAEARAWLDAQNDVETGES